MFLNLVFVNRLLLSLEYIIVFGVILWLVCACIRQWWFTKLSGFPGPQPELIFGNIRNTILSYGSLHRAFQALNDRYGDIYEIFIGFQRVFIISDIRLIRQLLIKDRSALTQNSWTISIFSSLMPNGLVALTGNEHKRHIRALRPVMANSRIRDGFPFMAESMKRLVKRWSSRLNGSPYDFRHDLDCLGFELSTRFLFGRNVVLLDDDDNNNNNDKALLNDDDHQMDIQQVKRIQQLVQAIRVLGDANGKEAISLTLRTRLFGHSRQVGQSLDIIAKEVDLLHQEHIQCQLALNINIDHDELSTSEAFKRANLAALLLDSDESFTHKEICDEILLFMLAGVETSTSSQGWMLYFLAGEHQVQQRLRSEIIGLTGGSDPYITFDQMQPTAAPYLEAVYRECMRLACVAPAFTRTSARPIDTGDFVIPAKANIFFPIAVIQRDPRIWGPDANEFRPERWLNITPETRQSYMHASYQFGGGDRQCFGQRQAMAQLKLFLAVVTFYFRLDKIPIELHNDDIELCGITSRTACYWMAATPL
ncbi:cytochrome P450 [Syncephalis fuscata]|nr:cytochrome P450 [Syncephalis fuscata]